MPGCWRAYGRPFFRRLTASLNVTREATTASMAWAVSAGVFAAQYFWKARSIRVGCAPASAWSPAMTDNRAMVAHANTTERGVMSREYTARQAVGRTNVSADLSEWGERV